MPLSEKARVEVYLPDLAEASYQNLLEELDREFAFSFGGCTIIRGLEGSYLSRAGLRIHERVNLLYTDTPFSFDDNILILSRFADELRDAAFKALNEEAIVVVVYKVFHAE